jgi:hypothetical protein
MTKQDRQKLSIFIVLLAVLGLTLALGYRMYPTASAGDVPLPESKKSAALPATSDGARIRLDLVEKPEGSQEAGRKNPFQYGQAPAPPPPPGTTARTVDSALPPGVQAAPVASAPIIPPPPPPPPPIPLRFEGFAVINSAAAGGQLRAFLSDQARHYNVEVGEVLMGRYRITRISDSSVEVEDLEYKRRQVLPLVK